MDLIRPLRSCIDSITQTSGTGMKTMLLDEVTTSVMSVGCSRSEMLMREVYMFERIEDIGYSKDSLKYLKCLALLRPTKANIDLLCRELSSPHYRTYYLYFTGRLSPDHVSKIAEADGNEVVRYLLELPMDYIAITPTIFSLNLFKSCYDLKKNMWKSEGLSRASEGLASVLLALRVYPVIRYQTQSVMCRLLADRIRILLKQEETLNPTFRANCAPNPTSVLLILDRRIDLITPIINKWTYQAMLHEQLNIVNNRVNLSNIPDRKPQYPKELIISTEQDEFFERNCTLNYGEVGSNLKMEFDAIRNHSQQYKQQSTKTIGDMKRFIQERPETKRISSYVKNHVLILGELSRIVKEHNLFAISECEQEIACSSFSDDILKKIRPLISCNTVRPIDALRLVSLYCLCKTGSSDNNTKGLIQLLKGRPDITAEDIEFIRYLREFSLSKATSQFDEIVKVKVESFTRKLAQGLRGIDNVLTRYRPTMYKIIEDARRCKLKESQFIHQNETIQQSKNDLQELVIFVIGGATYDEALCVEKVNQSQTKLKIILGGTSIHNFSSFIEEVTDAMKEKES